MPTNTCLALTVSVLVASPTVAFAQFPNYPEPNLPTMRACAKSQPQPLPELWQATTLMSPYVYAGKPGDLTNLSSRAELQVGRLVYNAPNRLMRGTRYGAKLGGVLDLLISDKATYVLAGDYQNPRCIGKLGTPYKVPSRTWQDARYKPICVGNHATAPTIDTGPKVDWWKQQSPIKDPGAVGQAADWYWFDQNGFPTRTMFWAKHDGLPAILGDYAFTTFYKFERGNDVDLKKILASCESAGDLPVMSEDNVAEQVTKTASAQNNQASTLIPGLSYEGCAALGAQPPTWPVPIYMTSFSTAAKYSTPLPLVTSVYYQSSVPQIRTRLHKASTSGPVWSDALLIGQTSYGVDTSQTPPYKQLGCAAGPHTSLPGSPHLNWGVVGSCQCMATIRNNPVLSPNRNTEIIGCPLPLVATKPGEQNGNTMFWMWYTITNPMRPIVFLQSMPDVTIGTGLSLADYVYWQPSTVPNTIFTTPAAGSCPPPTSGPVAPAPCLGCHNPSTND